MTRRLVALCAALLLLPALAACGEGGGTGGGYGSPQGLGVEQDG